MSHHCSYCTCDCAQEEVLELVAWFQRRDAPAGAELMMLALQERGSAADRVLKAMLSCYLSNYIALVEYLHDNTRFNRFVRGRCGLTTPTHTANYLAAIGRRLNRRDYL